MMGFKRFSALMGLLAIVAAVPQADGDHIQGFSREGLKKLTSKMHAWVDAKHGANMVTLLSRKGEIVDFDAYGVLDISAETKKPVTKDTIFRIMSMTKPIVGAGFMMMYEEGKWKLDDLLSKHIPEFKDLKVKLANGTLVDPIKPITMAMVVSHSAGFPGMLTVPSPTLGGIIPPLVAGQLAFQPGRDWRYGPGVEIQGYLIEKWSGKDLSDFLTERLFTPLGLEDTGFFIDRSKVGRVTKLHTSQDGNLASTTSFTATSKPRRLSPSGGLMSTAKDYWKFCQMILNGGELGGKRILKPESVTLMHTNNLEPDISVGLGAKSKGTGFGVDFAIIMDPKASRSNEPEGSFYWGGAYGTWFWIDPKNEVVFVGMIQNTRTGLSGEGTLRSISAKAVYDALKN
jgi:CubicO group peptidase (beta-lactamase class C family)